MTYLKKKYTKRLRGSFACINPYFIYLRKCFRAVLLPGYATIQGTNSGLLWRMWRRFVLLSGCKRELRGVKIKRLCFGLVKN